MGNPQTDALDRVAALFSLQRAAEDRLRYAGDELSLDPSMDASQAVAPLLNLAKTDTGGARRAAGFLLSLWDGGTFGCDLQLLLSIDTELFELAIGLLIWLHVNRKQLDSIVPQEDMDPILRQWGDVLRRDQKTC